MTAHSEDPVSDVVDFVGRFLEDAAGGGPLELEDYVRRYPDHPAEIERAHADLVAELAASALGAAPRRVGHYRILERLGVGGQGIVYLAEDERAGRRVALKVLHPAKLGSRNARERFRREARIIARLDDPGLCSVYDSELEGETPHIVMRYLDGETLARRIARRISQGRSHEAAPDAPAACAPRGRRAVDETLAAFEELARSLHVAHEAGVVHRDIKPGNVIATTEGRLVLCDFGLARSSAAQDVTLTLSGDACGTPAYMSPEQLTDGAIVDRRTDVYALGVTLYEALTLERPFRGAGLAEQRRAILGDRVPDPLQYNADLPRELATVLETVLERDVARRYPTAAELADELARVRRREPIHARRPGLAYQARRFVERNRRATAVLVALVVLLAAAVGGLLSARSARAVLARRTAAESRVLAVEAAIDGNAVDAARRLSEARALVAPTDPAGPWESRLVRRLTDQCTSVVPGGPRGITAVHVAEGGARGLVSADGRLHRVDLATGDWRLLESSASVSLWPKWSATGDGSRVLVRDERGGLVLLDALADRRVGHLHAAWQPAYGAFDPAAERLAVSSFFEPVVRVLDARTLETLEVVETPGASSYLCWDADGERLFGMSSSSLWSRSEGEPARAVASIDPMGPRSLGGDGSGIVLDNTSHYVLYANDGSVRSSGTMDIWEVALDPTGTLSVTADGRALRVRDAWTGELLASLAGHEAEVLCFGFDRGGRLLSADAAGTLRAWDLGAGPPLSRTVLPKVDCAGISDRRIVTVDRDTHMVWDASTVSELRTGVGPPEQNVRAVGLGPDGAHVALAGMQERSSVAGREDDVRVAVIEADGGASVWSARVHGWPLALAVRPEPLAVAVGFADGRLAVLDAHGAEVVSLAGVGAAVRAVAWSPDGRTLAALGATADGGALLTCRAADDGRELWTRVLALGAGEALAFSADGARVAAGSDVGGLVTCDARDGTPRAALEELGARICALAFHPREPRLAAIVGTRLVLWDVSGPPLQTMRHELGIGLGRALAFRDGGDALTAVGQKGIVTLETVRPDVATAHARETARRQRTEALALFGSVPALYEIEARVDAATAARAAFHENVDQLNLKAWAASTTDAQDEAYYERALGWARRAVHLAPWRGRYWNTLGTLQLRLGRSADAIESLRRAARLDAEAGATSARTVDGASPFHLYPLAVAHARLGELDAARAAFDEAVRIHALFKARPELEELRKSAEAALRAAGD